MTSRTRQQQQQQQQQVVIPANDVGVQVQEQVDDQRDVRQASQEGASLVFLGQMPAIPPVGNVAIPPAIPSSVNVTRASNQVAGGGGGGGGGGGSSISSGTTSSGTSNMRVPVIPPYHKLGARGTVANSTYSSSPSGA